jgi:hypothetical protein
VRQLHTALVQSFPHFLVSDLPSQVASGSTTFVHQSMSPLESVLLFCMLAHQKLTNPQYQMTAAEFSAADTARHNGQRPAIPANRTSLIQAAIQQSASTISANTISSEVTSALSDLGVAGGGL